MTAVLDGADFFFGLGFGGFVALVVLIVWLASTR